MATTALGKYLRKISIDHDERLYDMAENLGISSAFLSSVENGHKKASDSLINKIIENYHLTQEQQKELLYAKSKSVSKIDLSSFSPEKQEATLMFARKFDDLTDEQVQRIRKILKGDDESD